MLRKCHWIVLYTVHSTAFCLGGGEFFPGHGVVLEFRCIETNILSHVCHITTIVQQSYGIFTCLPVLNACQCSAVDSHRIILTLRITASTIYGRTFSPVRCLLCVQGSASECVLVSMLAARHAALEELKVQYPGVEDGVLLARMVAYCSKLVRVAEHF